MPWVLKSSDPPKKKRKSLVEVSPDPIASAMGGFGVVAPDLTEKPIESLLEENYGVDLEQAREDEEARRALRTALEAEEVRRAIGPKRVAPPEVNPVVSRLTDEGVVSEEVTPEFMRPIGEYTPERAAQISAEMQEYAADNPEEIRRALDIRDDLERMRQADLLANQQVPFTDRTVGDIASGLHRGLAESLLREARHEGRPNVTGQLGLPIDLPEGHRPAESALGRALFRIPENLTYRFARGAGIPAEELEDFDPGGWKSSLLTDMILSAPLSYSSLPRAGRMLAVGAENLAQSAVTPWEDEADMLMGDRMAHAFAFGMLAPPVFEDVLGPLARRAFRSAKEVVDDAEARHTLRVLDRALEVAERRAAEGSQEAARAVEGIKRQIANAARQKGTPTRTGAALSLGGRLEPGASHAVAGVAAGTALGLGRQFASRLAALGDEQLDEQQATAEPSPVRERNNTLAASAALVAALIAGRRKPNDLLPDELRSALRHLRDGPEFVVSAAIGGRTLQGRPVTGETHADAWARLAIERGLATPEDDVGVAAERALNAGLGGDEGFVTSRGRFVDRAEANDLLYGRTRPSDEGNALIAEELEEDVSTAELRRVFRSLEDAARLRGIDPDNPNHLLNTREWRQARREQRAGHPLPDGNDEVYRATNEYARAKGYDVPRNTHVEEVDEGFAKRVADWYDSAESNPNDPLFRQAVREFYETLEEQAEMLRQLGYDMEPVLDDPYPNSFAMMRDLEDNKRIKVYAGETETPFATHEQVVLFRWVHDIMGHGGPGNQFGPVGEERAYREHARTFPPLARRLLASLTRGQNSWVNYGPHMRRPDGTIPRRGDPDFVPPGQRPFAEQKAVLMPEELMEFYPDPAALRTIGDIDAHANAAAAIHRASVSDPGFEGGGSTYSIHDGDMIGKPFFSVAVFTERQRLVDGDVTPEMLRDFIRANADLLADRRNVVGTWFDPDEGKTLLEVSTLVPGDQIDEAVTLGQQYNQKEIFDLSNVRSISTGGTGTVIPNGPPDLLRVMRTGPAAEARRAMAQEIERVASEGVDPEIVERVRRNLENIPEVSFRQASPEEFHAAIQRAAPESKGQVSVGQMLSDYSVEDYRGMRTFLSEDGRTGYAIKPDGDLVSVFNVGQRGAGAAAVLDGIRNGAEKLDAFEPYLPVLYHELGFEPYRLEANWDMGGQPVAYMRLREGVDRTNPRATVGTFGDYERPGLVFGEGHPLRSGAMYGLGGLTAAGLLGQDEEVEGSVLAAAAAFGTRHGVLPKYLVGTRFRPRVQAGARIAQSTTPKNAARMEENLNRILAKHTEPWASEDAWNRMVAEALGSSTVPIPPYAALRRINNPEVLAEELSRLSPEQIEAAERGLADAQELRSLYESGRVQPKTTAKILFWSYLSRRAPVANQEALFLDAAKGIDEFVDAAVRGEWTPEIEARYLAWASTVAPEGSMGRGNALANLFDFGRRFLPRMAQKGEDGRTHLQWLHDALAGNQPSKEIRREFWRRVGGERVGIDNKVLSFALLETGRTDVLVIDRVRTRLEFDDGRFGGANIYDGDDYGSLSELFGGHRGLMYYEALEDGYGRILDDAFGRAGIGDASLGKYHWLTWVLGSTQEVGHDTMEVIAREAAGRAGTREGVFVREGRFDTYGYGAQYGYVNDRPVIRLPVRSGAGQVDIFGGTSDVTPGVYEFDPADFVKFMAEVKNPRNGVVPRNFKVSDAKERPWVDDPRVAHEKLAELASRFGRRVEDPGAPGAAPAPDAAGRPGTGLAGGVSGAARGGPGGPGSSLETTPPQAAFLDPRTRKPIKTGAFHDLEEIGDVGTRRFIESAIAENPDLEGFVVRNPRTGSEIFLTREEARVLYGAKKGESTHIQGAVQKHIKKLKDAGLLGSAGVIAAVLAGEDEESQLALAAAGLVGRRGGRPPTDTKVANKIVELYRAGKSMGRIAADLGMHKSTVSNVINRASAAGQVEVRPGGRPKGFSIWMDPEDTPNIVRGRDPEAAARLGTHKSPIEREREVVALRKAGRTYKQIGDELGVSASTVDKLIRRAKKRGLWDQVGAAAALGAAALSDKDREEVAALVAASPFIGRPRFYSRLQVAIERGPKKTTGAKWLKIVKSQTHKQERRWSGIEEFLNERKGQSLTRDEVLDHVRQNPIKLTERTLTEEVTYTPELRARRDELDALATSRYDLARELRERMKGAGYSERSIEQYARSPYGRLFAPDEEQVRAIQNARGRLAMLLKDHDDLGFDNNREAVFHIENELAAIAKGNALYDVNGAVRSYDWGDEEGRARATRIFNQMVDAYRAHGEVLQQDGPPELQDLLGRYREAFQAENRARNEFHNMEDEHRRANRARFSAEPEYRLPGGENYREILIQLSPESAKGAVFTVPEHWGKHENVVVHVRLSDRTLPNGERVLFIEEIQSDWQQRGRKEGFGAIDPEAGGVPDTPFQDSNDVLGLAWKRVLDEAVDGGYDRIAWTTGRQQVERYDLSKHVRALMWDEQRGVLYGFNDEGQYIVEQDGVTRGNLARYVGEDIAEKLANAPLSRGPHGSPAHRLDGQALVADPEGAGLAHFYDRMVPDWIRSYGKKNGVAVEPEGIAILAPDPEPPFAVPSIRVSGGIGRKLAEEGFPILGMTGIAAGALAADESEDLEGIKLAAFGFLARRGKKPGRAADPVSKILSRVDRGGMPAVEPKRRLEKAYTYWLDHLFPIKKATKEVAEITGGRRYDPEMLARAAQGDHGYAAEVLKRGVHAPGTLDRRTRGLEEIYAEIGERQNDLIAYRVAKRALELMDPNRPGGAKTTGFEGMEEELRAVVSRLEKDPLIQRLHNELKDYHKQWLKLLEEEGVLRSLTKEERAQGFKSMADLIESRGNQEYTPFFRSKKQAEQVFGPTKGGKRLANLPGPVRRLLGSERPIIDPMESDIRMTFVYSTLVMRQRVANSLAEIAENVPDQQWIKRIRTPMQRVSFSKEQLKGQVDDHLLKEIEPEHLSVFSRRPLTQRDQIIAVNAPDGKKRYYEVEPTLYEALMGMSGHQLTAAVRLLSLPASILRTGVTIMPDFAIANFIRDALQTAVTSDAKGSPPRALVRAVSDGLRGMAALMVAKNPGAVKRTVKAGAFGAAFGALTPTESEDRLEGAAYGAAAAGAFGAAARGIARGGRLGKKRVTDTMKPEDIVSLWRSSGGDHAAYLSMDRRAIRDAIRQMRRQGRSFPFAATPMDAIRAISEGARGLGETFENATRVGEFMAQLDKAGSADPMAATAGAVFSRDVSTDFKRHGAGIVVEILRPMAAFWNARVQGLDKIRRQARVNPKRVFPTLALTVTAPSMALYTLNTKLAESDPEQWDYWDRPMWERNMFWLVPLPEGGYLRIPKPFELGLFFGSLPERMVEAFDPRNPHRGGMAEIGKQAWENFASLLAETFLPIPTAAIPWIENFVNFDMFTGRPIHPQYEAEELDERLKGRERSSEVAGRLSDLQGAMTDVVSRRAPVLTSFAEWLQMTPAEIDNVLRDYTGSLGREIVHGADRLLRDEATRGKPPTPQRSQRPLTGRFFGDVPHPYGENVEQFYDAKAEAEGAKATFDKLIEMGRIEQAESFLESKASELAAADIGQDVAKQFAQLRELRKMIENSPDMTPDEKRAEIDEVNQMMSELAREVGSLMRELKREGAKR